MAEKERIINKLKDYCIKNMGFKKDGEGIKKTLKDEKDFFVTDNVVLTILSGSAYGGKIEYLYSLIEDNYISEIEDRFSDFLNLTEKEREWLDEDEDGCYGADIISEWIWDYFDVTAARNKVDWFARNIANDNGLKIKEIA